MGWFNPASIVRHLGNRARYADTRSWLLSLANRAMMSASGPRALHKRQVRIALAGEPKPFWLRLGSTDWLVVEEIYFRKEYESCLRLVPQPVRTIADLGANIGLSLRYLADRCPEATIVGVEPEAGNLAVCRLNIAEGGLGHRVRLIEACAGAHSRRGRLLGGGGDWGYTLGDDSTGTGPAVQVVTMAAVFEALGTSEIDLLKCDVEGAEAELFCQDAQWCSQVRHMVIELHAPYSPERLLTDLARAGARFALASQAKSGRTTVVVLTRTV